jgi:RNA recognition motif-containing protein
MDALTTNISIAEQRRPSDCSSDVKLTPVILVCIHNVNNTQITHDLLHTVFSTYGKILRILIFEKTKKWKAFIEYSDLPSASQARDNLDEFLLFSDGTRMNIYPSNLPRIKFQNNNSGGIDYTLLEEQGSMSLAQTVKGLLPAKKIQDDFHNQTISPKKKKSDTPDEHVSSNSTSAETGSGFHSADDDKDDEILKMIEDNYRAKQEDNDENQAEDENEKDGFLEEAFNSFKTPGLQYSQSEYRPPSWNTGNDYFFPNSQPPTLNKNSHSFNPFDFTSHTIQKSESYDAHSYTPFSPLYNTNNIQSSQDLSYFGNGMNSFQYKSKSQNNVQFDDNNIDQDIISKIMNKIQNPEFQDLIQSGEMEPIDYETLSQWDKPTLIQYYTNLTTMVQKENDFKKSAVLHVNCLENKDIKVQMLFNIFSNFGNITKIIFMRSKTSALIEFENADYASVARDYLNNIMFMGRPLRINYSNYPSIQIRNKQNKGPEETFMGNPRNFRFNKNKNISINPPSSVLHISNLTKEVCKDNAALKEHFALCGKVEGLKFLFGDNGKNMCLLRMSSNEEALKAMAYLHDTEVGGRRIQISFTRSKI